MNKIISFFTLLIFAGILYVGWQAISFVTIPASRDDSTMYFEVNPGESFTKVAKRLESKELITDSNYLKIYSKLKGVTEDIRVGEYKLSGSMTPAEILRILASGKSVLHSFTVPEGQNIYEIAEILSAAGFGSKKQHLQTFQDPALIERLLGKAYPSLEGYLFPETYRVTKYASSSEIAEMMVKRFFEVWSEVYTEPSKLSRHEVVTLASVVEKETGAPHERPIISSVFHNRLKKGMRLQSDPTIIYGIAMETGKIIKNIRKKDIRAKNAYNTYTVKALPAGPISNPGKESLIAVLNPERTDYLYFVSRNNGTHVFSKTLKQHNQAVRKFQLNKKARKGKSWRDLKN